MAALNRHSERKNSRSTTHLEPLTLEPLMPLSFNKDNFFAFRNDGPRDTILYMPLKEMPGFTREELSSDIHAFGAIMHMKYPGNESKDFCRGSEGINEQYLMGRVQSHSYSKDAVIYYYDEENAETDTANPDEYENFISCVGGVMTITVKPHELHMSGWCIPYKNSDRKKGKGKGLASDFIQILITTAELNHKRKITLECYGDDLKALYEKKGFHVTKSENINGNSQNSNAEMVTKYDMEYLLPDMAPGAPHPKPRRRHRTRSANSMKLKRYGTKKRSKNTFTLKNRRVSRRKSI
jgi:hypothetical protein